MTDAAQQLALAASDGARTEPQVDTIVLRCDRAGSQDVLDADGYLFVTPEYLASMAGMMKDFFDRTYYDVLDRVQGRPYATMVAAGSDGQGAARQVARIAQGWRLRPVAEPLVACTRAQSPEAIRAPKVLGRPELDRAADLGAALAAGLALGVW